METNISATHCEENELLREKLILYSLMDDGIISDIEYRLYASGSRFVDRKAAILEIILSKYKQEPNYVLEMCKRLTSTNENEKDVNLYAADTEVPSILIPSSIGESGKNPLLNIAILQCMFDFASLKDLKKFRLVCRQWNFIVEPLLRKKSRIHFNLCLMPKQFITTFQNSLPDLPFSSFRFSSTEGGNKYWNVSNLKRFFDKWGNNIKELNFDKIGLSVLRRKALDISSLLANTLNLTNLTISTNSNFNDPNYDENVYLYGTGFEIQLERLATIKFISLTNCTVVLPINQNKNHSLHIIPSEITLDGVRFKKVENNETKILTDVRLNNFIDFSRAKIISVTNRTDTIFDMTAQIFNSTNLRLQSIKIVNLELARGKLDSFHTSEDYMQAIQLEIKEFKVTNSTVDLSVLPRTIKKLHLEDCSEIICNSAIQLPDLQFACFRLHEDDFELVSRFAACQNLVELELAPYCSRETTNYDFDVKLIPRSVKRMKITRINLIGRKITLNLDTLIVQIDYHWSFISHAATNIYKMNSKVKTLIVSCNPSHSVVPNSSEWKKIAFWNEAFCSDSAEEIIRLNKKFKKIIVGIEPNFDEENSEKEEDEYAYDRNRESDEGDKKEQMDFSRLVDKKANYYMFQNQRGKVLSQEEFKQCTKK